MKLFCFASRNENNIWRGVKANKWAVATVSDSAMRGRITKARRYFVPGVCGLLYLQSDARPLADECVIWRGEPG